MAWLIQAVTGDAGWFVQFILSEVMTLVVREGARMVKAFVCRVCVSEFQASGRRQVDVSWGAAIPAYRHSLLMSS